MGTDSQDNTILDCLIIGAGLCGLSAAHALHREGLKFAVIEQSDRVGGVIQSVQESGYLVEAGPNTFPSFSHRVRDLCQTLGLQPVEASSSSKKRYLYLHQRLMAMPSSPLGFAASRVLSARGKLRLLTEPFVKAPLQCSDESIASFITRRFGHEVLEHLVGPFLSGIYAGDPENLSLPATFPQIADWENTYGSVIKGAIKYKKSNKKGKNGQKRERYALMSFQGGMAELPHALADSLPESSMHLSASVQSITPSAFGYHVKLLSGETYQAKAIIFATPSNATAGLIKPFSSELAQTLAAIPYAPLNVVHLGVPESDIPKDLDGFGFLVPRRENITLLGCIWSSSLFPNRAPSDQVLLSCFIGGALHPETENWSDEQLTQQVLGDLARIFSVDTITPTFRKLFRYARAIPQYTLGHTERLGEMDRQLGKIPGLFLTGNYLRGVSLNDCVLQGQQSAQAVLRYIGGSSSGGISCSGGSGANSSGF